MIKHQYIQAQSEHKQSLTFRVRRYVVIAMKPVYRLQIRPIVYNYRAPLPFPKLHPGQCSSVGMQRGTTHRQTHRHRDHYTFRVLYDSREMKL